MIFTAAIRNRLCVLTFLLPCFWGCPPNSKPLSSQPSATGNTREIDLAKLTGIAEVSNLGLSPGNNRLLVLGMALKPAQLSHEAWLIDLDSPTCTAKQLFSEEKGDCFFAWSADNQTLLTHRNGKARYWNCDHGAEIEPLTNAAELLPKELTLASEFSEADKLLQVNGFQTGRGWLTDFTSYGAACCPNPGFTITIAFPGQPTEREIDTGAWWLRFAPQGRALFWIAKDSYGTIYRVTPEDTINEKGESSPKSRVARLDNLFAIGKHGAEVRSAAITMDGSRIFTAGMDGIVRIWDVAQRKMMVETNAIADLPVKAAELWAMELSKDATNLLVYAQPLDKKQHTRPGRLWLQKLSWPSP